MTTCLYSLLLFLVTLTLAASCTQSSSTPNPSDVSIAPTTQELIVTPTLSFVQKPTTDLDINLIPYPYSLITIPPDRDILDISIRIGDGHPESQDIDLPKVDTHLVPGSNSMFWVVDPIGKRASQITATLIQVSEHAYWYFEDGFIPDPDNLIQAIDTFESKVYPLVTEAFGTKWISGRDNDHRLTILHTDLGPIDGYYRATDEYPQSIQRLSNERGMVYINLHRIKLGTSAHGAVLAHELQHAIHWASDHGEETWVNEGLSEVAKAVAGYGFSSKDYFLADPSVSLNNWPSFMKSQLPYYGGSGLFMEYFAQHYGGYENMHVFLETESDGIAGINDYLQSSGYDDTFDDAFKNWMVANYLDSWGLPGYSYDRVDVQIDPHPLRAFQLKHNGLIPQYGGDYIEINNHTGNIVLDFHGEPQVPIIPIDLRDGSPCWWGNHGDSIDSSMTASFDLSEAITATLNFFIWYAIEDSWDYAYVQASRDGGQSWDILQGSHMSPANPVGPDIGPGYTGETKVWLKESIDLTPYIGESILLRFEYITDETINDAGVCIDNISIPEIGFFDELESPELWRTAGFIPINNLLPQQYSVQIIEVGKSPVIKTVNIADDGTGSIEISGLGETLDKAVIIIAAVNPNTKQKNSYTLYIADKSQ